MNHSNLKALTGLTNPTDYHLKRLREVEQKNNFNESEQPFAKTKTGDNGYLSFKNSQPYDLNRYRIPNETTGSSLPNDTTIKKLPSLTRENFSAINDRNYNSNGENLTYTPNPYNDIGQISSASNFVAPDNLGNNERSKYDYFDLFNVPNEADGYDNENCRKKNIKYEPDTLYQPHRCSSNGGQTCSYLDLTDNNFSYEQENQDRFEDINEIIKTEYDDVSLFNDNFKTTSRASMSCPKDLYFPAKFSDSQMRPYLTSSPNKGSYISGQTNSSDEKLEWRKDCHKSGGKVEKEKIRKFNHNRVERARRDNINDRIKELATLLPQSIDLKHNKGTILKASVNYLKECQNFQNKIRGLEERQIFLENLCRDLIGKIKVLEDNQKTTQYK